MDNSTLWDFTKLPECEHGNVIQMYNVSDRIGLMNIVNKYQIAPNHLCCGSDGEDTLLQFQNAIEKGWIQ